VPLGNPLDASAHLREAIEQTPFIAAEDSRKFARLCQDLGVTHSAKVISFFEGNEGERIAGLLEILKSGSDLLVVTDAGMPGISDPGYRLSREAIAADIQVKIIPGPSAVTTALLLSGLPTDRFAFDGFPPRTQSARLTWFGHRAKEERTLVLFEAPHRLVESLTDAAAAFGANREAAICREMTKRYEETVRGTLAELVAWASSREILGEISLVIGGYTPDESALTETAIIELVLARESAGESRKEAIAEVAKAHNLQKRDVFNAMVAYKSTDKIAK
jgi:16S rRNA (cytidine1402-2'-O)-methyltransferase